MPFPFASFASSRDISSSVLLASQHALRLKRGEPCELIARLRAEFPGASAPAEAQSLGVQRVIGEKQLMLVRLSQSTHDEAQIDLLVRTVNFVTHDGMAGVGQVNANLVLAPVLRSDATENTMQLA